MMIFDYGMHTLLKLISNIAQSWTLKVAVLDREIASLRILFQPYERGSTQHNTMGYDVASGAAHEAWHVDNYLREPHATS